MTALGSGLETTPLGAVSVTLTSHYKGVHLLPPSESTFAFDNDNFEKRFKATFIG